MAALIRGERYHDIEEQFILQVLNRAGSVTNNRNRQPLVDEIKARLQKGSREYGDAQFWNADCIEELREECLDLIGWGALQYVKYLQAGDRAKANQLCIIISQAVRINDGLQHLKD
jgi:hypothetical protein